LQLSANIQQITNLDNDPSHVVNLESYTLLNAKAMYNLSKNMKIYVSGENLLGQSYQANRYYTMPEATIFAGINLNF
jgi:iron complex outermembrane receptor protein